MALNITYNGNYSVFGTGTETNPYVFTGSFNNSSYPGTGYTQLITFEATTDGTIHLSFNGQCVPAGITINNVYTPYFKVSNNYGDPLYQSFLQDLNGDLTFDVIANDYISLKFHVPPGIYQYVQFSIDSSIYLTSAAPPPQLPVSLFVINQPNVLTSGQLLSPQPSIGIQDSYGNPLVNYETDVQASLIVVSGSATLTGTTTVSTTSGVATFTDLVITGNGLFYLQFDSTILALNSVNSNQLFFPPDAGNPNPPIPVKPKRSYVSGSVPAYTDLEVNEFAINVADRKGYMRDSNDIVHLLFDGYASGGGGSGGTVYSVGVSSTDLDVSNSPITTSGFIGLDLKTQTLTAATYGDASNVAEVTVNDKGIVTGIQNVAISYPVNSITAGTDISLTGTAPDYTINNTAPDQIVSITSGTGISVTGTYPDFTVDSTITQYTDADARLVLSAGTGISYDNTTGVITNSDPDQIVGLTGGTDISVTGTYPNFTIDYTGTNTGVTSIIAGTGISVDAATGAVTVTNTDPDQVVSLTAGTGISVTGTYPNFTIDSTITQYTDSDARLSLSAGTGISYDNTTGVITNSEPDQVVSLTGGTDIGVTGTYPNFTIDYTGTAGTGTVTSVGITSTAAALTITNSPITTSGDIGVNFAGKGSEYVTGDGSLKTFPTTIDQALNLVTEVYNSTGSTLTKGTVVYIDGGQGNLPTVTKAQANSDANSAQTYGVVQADITNNNNGYVVVIGRLTDIDTQAYTSGTQLYLSPTTAGAWTTTKPSAPSHLVYVGIVVYSHPTQGVVEIKIQNGYELDELHDVSITSVASNNILRYNSSTKVWENVAGTTSSISEGTNLYYTDARARLSLSAGTGISYNNTTGAITNSSPDQTVVLTAGTGISTSGTYPNFTITNSAPDQTVKLTAGTGISTSGTYPNFTITNSSPDQTVTLTAGTNISITGTYPSFTIAATGVGTGTVTSVGLSAPTGMKVTNSPITSSGTIALSMDTGYALPTSASQTNWDTAYTNRITSLTTTGSSGSATLVSNTLNVPTYTLAGLGGIKLADLSSTATGLTYTNTTGVFSFTSGYSIPTTSSQTNWDSAYSERRQWDGGSTNLVAATGRTSLGGTIVGSNLFTLTNPSAVTFLKVNADNTVTAESASTFRTSIGAGTGTITSIATSSPITGGTITSTGTIGINSSSTNTASYVVQRDASGNFAAGTITASLTGTASTATNLAGGAGGSIPYQSSAGITAMLSNGTSGQVLQSNGGSSAPSWASAFPSGVMQMFGGSITQSVSSGTLTTTAPSGWALCDGSAISRTTYSALFTAIGTTYGTGDGSTTFNIPDLRSRSPIGAGTGSGLSARTLGTNYGAESVTLAANQIPTLSTGGMSANSTHSHNLTTYAASTGSSGYRLYDRFGNETNVISTDTKDLSHTHSITNASQQSTSILHPTLTVNYIIKL